MTALGPMAFLSKFERLLVVGGKGATIRRGPHGRQGDTFTAFGYVFRLVYDPAPMSLRVAMKECARDLGAGAGGPIEVLRNLAEAYPNEAWMEDRIVWVHFFERVGPMPVSPPTVESPPTGG